MTLETLRTSFDSKILEISCANSSPLPTSNTIAMMQAHSHQYWIQQSRRSHVEILLICAHPTLLPRWRQSLKSTRFRNREYLLSRCSVPSTIHRHGIDPETFWALSDSKIVCISCRGSPYLQTSNFVTLMQKQFHDHLIRHRRDLFWKCSPSSHTHIIASIQKNTHHCSMQQS